MHLVLACFDSIYRPYNFFHLFLLKIKAMFFLYRIFKGLHNVLVRVYQPYSFYNWHQQQFSSPSHTQAHLLIKVNYTCQVLGHLFLNVTLAYCQNQIPKRLWMFLQMNHQVHRFLHLVSSHQSYLLRFFIIKMFLFYKQVISFKYSKQEVYIILAQGMIFSLYYLLTKQYLFMQCFSFDLRYQLYLKVSTVLVLASLIFLFVRKRFFFMIQSHSLELISKLYHNQLYSFQDLVLFILNYSLLFLNQFQI